MEVAAIVTAAGSGTRMGSDVPKQFLPLCGVPILGWALRAIETSPLVGMIAVVVPEDYMKQTRKMIKDMGFRKCLDPVAGGRTRQESVKAGFDILPPVGIVLIHDGARPFVSGKLISGCVEAASRSGAALCAVRPSDTVKYSEDGKEVDRTLDRDRLWLAQTPQAFRYFILSDSYRKLGPAAEYTDEAMLVEAAGHPVTIVEGSQRNIKITSPEDMLFCKALLEIGSGREDH